MMFMSWNQLKSNKLLAVIAVGLSVVVLCYSLAKMTWLLLDPGLTDTASSAISQKPVVMSNARKSPVPQIVVAPLFGDSNKASTKPVTVQASKLDLLLHGIIYSTTEAHSRAFLERKGLVKKYFKIGDQITARVKLHQIYPDKVVLDHNGNLEQLLLIKTTISTGLTQAAAHQDETPAEIISQYRDKYSSSPMELARQFRSFPVRQGGKYIGYRLESMQGEELLDKLGIRNTDIITEVNGVKLDGPLSAVKVLQSLKTANTLQAKLLRNGQLESINIQL